MNDFAKKLEKMMIQICNFLSEQNKCLVEKHDACFSGPFSTNQNPAINQGPSSKNLQSNKICSQCEQILTRNDYLIEKQKEILSQVRKSFVGRSQSFALIPGRPLWKKARNEVVLCRPNPNVRHQYFKYMSPTTRSKFVQLADRFEKLGSSNEKLENHLLPECKTSQAGIHGLNIPS